LEGQLSLFEATTCKAILTPKGYSLHPDLLNKSGIPRYEVPETVELLIEGEVREYKFSKSFDDAKDDPLAVLHTSGTTGLPKPVVITHLSIASFDIHRSLDDFNGYPPTYSGFNAKSIFNSLPPFHVRLASNSVDRQYLYIDRGLVCLPAL